MPHLLIDRLRTFPSLTIPQHTDKKKKFPYGSVLIELLDFVAAIIFIWGSVCFLPAYSKDLITFLEGCVLFVVGSALYCVICLFALAEALKEKGPNSYEAWENGLYLIGSWVFFIGTFLYWPSKEHWHSLEMNASCIGCPVRKIVDRTFLGAIHFIIGSMLFAFAAFVNALNMKCGEEWSSRLLSAVTSLYLCGSLLFAMGSVAFFPNLGCGEQMVSIGAWAFIIGSVLFLIGSILSLYRLYHTIDGDAKSQEKEALRCRSASSEAAEGDFSDPEVGLGRSWSAPCSPVLPPATRTRISEVM